MKRNLYCNLIVLFILAACQPSPGGQGQAATVSPTASTAPTPTIEPTPTVKPYIDKLTDDFKKDTEELFGETSLQEIDGVWSLVDKEGRQAAGFVEGEWWINYALVGPRNIPSWDREEYLCDDEVEGSCGKIVHKKLIEMKVEDIPFPENFENNPFVKREMEWIENWLTKEIGVPLGKLTKWENEPRYKGTKSIFLEKIPIGQGKDFRWTILPFFRDEVFPQWPYPVWLVKVDRKGNTQIWPYFYKINEFGENTIFVDKSLRVIHAGTPCFDENFVKTDSDQFLWAEVEGIIASDQTDEFLNNQKWTLIPIGSREDIFLVYTSGGNIYEIFRPDNADRFFIRIPPPIK